MSHAEVVVFFAQIGAMLAAAVACGQLMRKLRQPAVLGELIGGVLLGPTVLQSFWPEVYAWIFPANPAINASRDAVLRIGMLFFLFVAGLEVNLTLLRRRGLALLLTSALGAAVPFALGSGAALAAPVLFGFHGEGTPWIFAVFLGTALSISALPVIARILIDLNLVRHQIGVMILAAATINDLMGWTLFAVIIGALDQGEARRPLAATLALVVAFTLIVFVLGRLTAWMLRRQSRDMAASPAVFIGTSGALVLGAATAAEAIGLHAVFGAFLVGLAVGHGMTPEEESRAHDMIHQFAVSFFAPLYFVSVGLRADFAHNFDLVLACAIVAIACVGKVGGAGLGAYLGGMSKRDAIAVGFGMNARGAMEMILATVALEHNLIGVRMFVALVVMAFVTSLLSGPVLRRLLHEPDESGGDAQRATETAVSAHR